MKELDVNEERYILGGRLGWMPKCWDETE